MSFEKCFMTFCELPVNGLVYLRSTDVKGDLEDYFSMYSDPEVFKLYEGDFHKITREYVKDELCSHVLNFLNKQGYVWTIADNKTGKAVGSISLTRFSCNNKIAKIGYFLSRSYWGKGIASDCVSAVTRFGFDELNIKRIYTTIHIDNPGSFKVLEKNGFKREGLLRKGFNLHGEASDCYIYSKLSDDRE